MVGTGRSFGAFAGYLWLGHVTSVQGSWTVPLIVPGSPMGHASTWVATYAHPMNNAFIQIGTTEERDPASTPDGFQNKYTAFWSDGTHSFHPQALFSVNPGDGISAQLSLSGGRWALGILDTTTGASKRFFTSDEAHASFNEAEWLQEDVTDGATGKPTPYPQLSDLRYGELAVNGAPPSYADLYSSWMSENGHSLAPSTLQNDSFTVRPATLSPAGQQYLRIIEPANTSTNTFTAQLARWTNGTPRSHITSATATYANALRASIRVLAGSQWPTGAEHAISAFIRGRRTLLAYVQTGASISPTGIAAWRSGFNGLPLVNGLAHEIRRALNVPEYTTQTIPPPATAGTPRHATINN